MRNSIIVPAVEHIGTGQQLLLVALAAIRIVQPCSRQEIGAQGKVALQLQGFAKDCVILGGQLVASDFVVFQYMPKTFRPLMKRLPSEWSSW